MSNQPTARKAISRQDTSVGVPFGSHAGDEWNGEAMCPASRRVVGPVRFRPDTVKIAFLRSLLKLDLMYL